MKKPLIFLFLIMVISASQAFAHVEDCYVWDATTTGYYSEVTLEYGMFVSVSGYAGTETEGDEGNPPFYCTEYEFGSFVGSYLTGPGIFGQQDLYTFDSIAEVEHESFEAEDPGSYCVASDHGIMVGFIWNDHSGQDQTITNIETTNSTNQCLTLDCEDLPNSEKCPTPTPTPTPTPCPLGFDVCPDVSANISQIDLVEKNSQAEVTVGVSNAEGVTTTFSLRATAGTGSATFDDGTTTKSFTGNVNNQVLRIKGVTESSQVDNIIIEAKHVTRLLASDNFTVAVISSLVFQRINTTPPNEDVP